MALIVLGSDIYEASRGSGMVSKSSNNGTSWTAVNGGLPSVDCFSFAVYGSDLILGTFQGLYKLPGGSSTWIAVNGQTVATTAPIPCLAMSGTNLVAGGFGGHAYISADEGANWSYFDNNLGGWTNQFSLMGDYLYCATWQGGVRKHLMLGNLTGINDIAQSTDDILRQNTPNPFGSNTTIRYVLPDDAQVTLKVYDQLGREMETLVSAPQVRGAHEAGVDASHLASGIYYYQLAADGILRTRQMLVLK